MVERFLKYVENLYRTDPDEFWVYCALFSLIFIELIAFIISVCIPSKNHENPRKKIVRTRILDVFSKYTCCREGAAGRALIGGIIAGPIGALAGASTAATRMHEQRKTRFKIWYADGHTAVKTVTNDSSKYMELVRYLK